jgi:hypothetical protein
MAGDSVDHLVGGCWPFGKWPNHSIPTESGERSAQLSPGEDGSITGPNGREKRSIKVRKSGGEGFTH